MVVLSVLALIGLALLFLVVLCSGPRSILGWLFFGNFWLDLLGGILTLMGEVLKGLTE